MSQAPAEVFQPDHHAVAVLARNVFATYAALIVDSALGLLMLPYNVTHLGTSAYGLWMLTASVTVHLTVLDLGYGNALVKFVARYRALRDVRALNEIASTVFFVFAAAGCLAYVAAGVVAFNLDHLFKITADQADIGRWVLLIVGAQVALNFPCSVFGGVVVGFQRQHLNVVVAIASSVAVAAANLAVLAAGHGLVVLVLATTSVRMLAYAGYAANAFRVFPALRLKVTLFRRARLKEVTGFSVYSSIIDWAYKLNYQADQLVIGAMIGAAPVAVWAVADRIVSATQNLTNQLNAALFPLVVDSEAAERRERLQQILLQGTRLSLATVLPLATALVVLADPLVRAWVGQRKPELLASVPVLQILSVAVAVRVGGGTATTLLKGAGCHRMLAATSITTGIANVAISVVLARVWGLSGVAIGTLIPIAASTVGILQPAACRRVGLPFRTLIARSIIPALWPAALMGAALSLLRPTLPVSIPAMAGAIAAGGVAYLAVFLVAIGRHDRALYVQKFVELASAGLARPSQGRKLAGTAVNSPLLPR